ncbi:MAG: alpha/beta fold hydrolase [Ardenticatenaceae bacterium]|nr:alpha/beta fold hydrolase [Ardenticatenaceae bacterium]
MKKFLRIALISTAVSIIIYFGAALIMAFWPEPTFAVEPFPAAAHSAADFTPQQVTMRDGETLFARRFPADSEDTILLLHGVTSDSAAFNSTAQMLRETSGAEVIALDLRGHGQSGGTPGHVTYIGQYEDDVADVIAAIRAEKPNGRLILAGHSMGGGIALRFAQLTNRPAVDGYLMFAPHLGTNAPTMPPQNPETAEAAAAYSQLNVPRLIGLIMLNNVGIKALNHLDTLYFNLTDEVTHVYSFGATANSSPQDYAAALTAVDAPMLVVVGSADEAFVAGEFETAVTAHSDGEVHVIDGENHTSIVQSATAMTIIQTWLGKTVISEQ